MFPFSSIKKTVFPENHLRFVHERRRDKDKSFFSIYIKLGSILENSKQKGLCHLVEHLMFKSSTKRTTLEISKALEKYGAEVNAYTSLDSICFHFSVLNEYFVECFEIFTEMFLYKNITQEEFNLEKEVVLQEYYMDLNNPEALCEDSHYKYYLGLDPVIGFEDTIRNLTLGDVNSFINDYFIPENMIISTVGNRSFHSVKKLIKKYYVNNSNSLYGIDGDSLWEKYINTKTKSTPKNNLIVTPADNKHVVLYATAPTMIPDKELYFCKYFSILFSKGLSSLLYREIRENKGLCYGIHFYINPFDEYRLRDFYGNYLTITTSTEVKKVPELLSSISYVLNSAVELITQEDIERTNNYFKSEKVLLLDYALHNAINFDNKSIKSLDCEVNKCKKMTLKQVIKAYRDYVLTEMPVKCSFTLRGKFNKRQLNKLPKHLIVTTKK